MIARDEYLSILKRFKDKELIKVITGIKKYDKSTLLGMFQEYLKDKKKTNVQFKFFYINY